MSYLYILSGTKKTTSKAGIDVCPVICAIEDSPLCIVRNKTKQKILCGS